MAAVKGKAVFACDREKAWEWFAEYAKEGCATAFAVPAAECFCCGRGRDGTGMDRDGREKA